MYLTINFAYKPVNTGNLIKQYIRKNAKTASPSSTDRASILQYMSENLDKVEPLSHDIGNGRKVITGVTDIRGYRPGMSFPTAHVAYVASAPTKSKLAKQSAVDDLADNLYGKLGDTGMFDLTPNTHKANEIYQAKLGTDPIGQGSGRGLKNIIRKRTKTT